MSSNGARSQDVDWLDAAVELLGRSGRNGTLRVQGQSMVPMIAAGESVTVDFAPPRLRRGDLLIFRQSDYLVVHRLIGHSRFPDGRRSMRTRGDAVLAMDPHLDPALVLGRVTAIEGDRDWWDLRRRAARWYGCAVAWHNLAWAALGIVAGFADRALVRLGLPAGVRSRIGWIDQTLLRAVHRRLFRRFHTSIPPPPGSLARGTPSASTTRNSP